MPGWDAIGSGGDLLALVPEAAEAFSVVVSMAAGIDTGATRAEAPAAEAWAEQFVLDVSSLNEDLRLGLAAALGDGMFEFVVAVWATDMAGRVEQAWRELTPGDSSAADRRDGEVDAAPGDLWAAVDAFLPVVARLDRLDAVTTEVVRLRGARANNCRLCKSLRSVQAVEEGAGESTFDAVDRYEASDLAESFKAALRLTDAMLWTPGVWPVGVAAGVRDHYTPEQAAELVLDVVRNGANRIAVALGADDPHVTSGVEYFAVEADGSLSYGRPVPSR